MAYVSLHTARTWSLLRGGRNDQLATSKQSARCTYEIAGHVLIDVGLANTLKCLICNIMPCIGQGDGCGSPNVCSICMLERGSRVSRAAGRIGATRHEGLTMIDLSTLL